MALVIRLVLLAIASLGLAYLSRASLIRPRSHGFYRFFAWEAIVALALVNFRGFAQWFADPLCARQIASWLLLTGSIVPVTWGTYLLSSQGKASAVRPDGSLFEFEKTTKLVTAGVFKYVRHPLYSSLLLLTWGVFLKRPSAFAAVLSVCATLFLLSTAKIEEAENREYFGAAYDTYMRRSKMFIPFVL